MEKEKERMREKKTENNEDDLPYFISYNFNKKIIKYLEFHAFKILIFGIYFFPVVYENCWDRMDLP